MPRLPDPERRALILRVARQHFARVGFSSTTMADIARAAAMGVGSLYVYFPTKDAIARTLIQRYVDELERAIVPLILECEGREAIARSIAAGLELAACNEDIILLLQQVSPEMSGPICQHFLQTLEPAVANQINQGYFHAGDPQFITQWINQQINWAMTVCVLEKRDSLALYQQHLTDLISRALLTSSGRSQTLEPQIQVDFDKNPPMPLTDYEQTVKRVNMGYDLSFLLTACFLRALGQPDLHLLIMGAGGGAEIERFLPRNPGWKITGIDPSQQMLAQAQAKVAALNVGERVTLVQGTVEHLAHDKRFDAATCLYVLHFLPDDAKLGLLRAVRDRLQPGAPLYLISGVRVDETNSGATYQQLRADFLGAWRQYGEIMGMPAEQMAGIVAQLTEQMSQPQVATAARVQELLREAGFIHIAPFYSILGAIYGWIAR